MIRIMTSNIWGDYYKNGVEIREDQLFETYRKYGCDIIGIQEVTPSWHQSALMRNMENAGYLILDDAPAPINNYNVMLVRKDRFLVVKSGYAPMPHTADVSKSMQWAVLENRQTGKTIAVCTAHFEYRREPCHDVAREFEAEELVWRMQYLMRCHSCDAAFGMGDMNAGLSSTIFDVYKKHGIQQLADLAPIHPTISTYHGYPVRGEDNRYHGTMTAYPYERSLDHIIGTPGDYRVLNYQIVTDQPALDATDHSPVFADLEF